MSAGSSKHSTCGCHPAATAAQRLPQHVRLALIFPISSARCASSFSSVAASCCSSGADDLSGIGWGALLEHDAAGGGGGQRREQPKSERGSVGEVSSRSVATSSLTWRGLEGGGGGEPRGRLSCRSLRGKQGAACVLQPKRGIADARWQVLQTRKAAAAGHHLSGTGSPSTLGSARPRTPPARHPTHLSRRGGTAAGRGAHPLNQDDFSRAPQASSPPGAAQEGRPTGSAVRSAARGGSQAGPWQQRRRRRRRCRHRL